MKRVFVAFREYLKPYRVQVFVLVLGLLIDLGFNALMPLTFKYLIDDAIPNRDRTMLVTLVGIMVAAVIVAGATAIGRDYLYAKLGTNVTNDLRLRMFEHLQRLSADFYGRTRVGDVMARFSTDLAAVNNAVVYAIPETVLGVLGIGFYSVILFTLEPRLAAIAVLGLPTLLIGPRILAPRAEEESLKVRNEEARIGSSVQENVAAQAVVRAFGLANLQTRAFRSQLDELYRRSLRFNLLSYLVERTPNVAFLVVQVVIVAVGAVMAFRGTLEIGSLVAFNSILLSLSVSITSLTRIMPLLLLASGGVERISSLLDETPTVQDPGSDEEMPPLQEAITFENVTFSYTGERKQLDDVTFTIPRGTNVAFVGSSGSGKSTVVNLLMRFFDPQAGVLAFDGRDIRSVSQGSLRKQIGIVFQESLLFNTTISDNIRMGRVDATDEDIEAAARAAEVANVIETFPDGYHSIVGERGGQLSGGQRQRVSIARAIVRNPPILILDEATSALDPATEAAINATIERLAADRTVVSITHRLASVLSCDRIFVLHQGRLVEQGNHEELVALGGLYGELWAKQSGLIISPDGRSASVTTGYLRSVGILEGLSEDVISLLSRLFVTEHFPEGRVLIQEGDRMVDKFYIIARGRVEVSKEVAGEEKRQVAVLQDGDHFGEIALVKDIPRTATVTTLTPCILLTLRRLQFLNLMSSDPRLQREISDLISVRSQQVGLMEDVDEFDPEHDSKIRSMA